MIKFSKLLILILVISACSSKEGDYFKKLRTFEEDYSKQIFAQIVDTLKIYYLTDRLNIKDFSTNRSEFLMARGISIDTILRVDTSGKVLRKLCFLGEDENSIGNYLFSVAYFQDTLIAVSSPRGFYWYDIEGNFIKSLKDPTPLLPYGSEPRRKMIFGNSDKNAILHLKSPEEFSIIPFNHELVNRYSSVTNYNLEGGTYNLVFPFEKESIYKKDNKYYGRPTTHFTFSEKTRKYYVLQNPDPQIFIYDENFNFLESINLKPDHFQIEIVENFNNKIDREYQSLNSRYISLDTFGDYVLVVYNSGLPVEEFRKRPEGIERPILYRDFMKYYGILLKDDQIIANDFPLPHGSIGVAKAIDLDEIYFKTNPYVTEIEEPFIFFRVSLEEK